jgi:hypothetical protein
VGEFIRARLPLILIVQGVLAWVTFVFLKYMAQEEVSVAPFLVWHLLGVVPAALMNDRGWMTSLLKRAVAIIRSS